MMRTLPLGVGTQHRVLDPAAFVLADGAHRELTVQINGLAVQSAALVERGQLAHPHVLAGGLLAGRDTSASSWCCPPPDRASASPPRCQTGCWQTVPGGKVGGKRRSSPVALTTAAGVGVTATARGAGVSFLATSDRRGRTRRLLAARASLARGGLACATVTVGAAGSARVRASGQRPSGRSRAFSRPR